MKKYISVFQMIARSSLYKVCLILIGMVIAEGSMLYLTITNPSGFNFEEYIDQSQYSLAFQIAYILVTIVIVLPGMNLGSNQSYTLQRLRIKERKIYWLQSLYNMLAYVLLWGVQMIMVFVSIVIYQKNIPIEATLSNQTMFLAFYRNNFMHSIFPLEDIPGASLIVIIGITTAFVAAEFTKLQRQGKFGFELLILIAAVIISFPRELGQDLAFPLISMAFVYFVLSVRFFLNMEVKEE